MDMRPIRDMELLLREIEQVAHAGQAGDVTIAAGQIPGEALGAPSPTHLTVHNDPGNMRARSLNGFHRYGEAYYYNPDK